MNSRCLTIALAAALAGTARAQFPPGFGPPPGGGFGPPGMVERKILKDFDADKNGWLDDTERAKARESLKNDGVRQRMGTPGGFPRGGGRSPETKPGPKVAPSEVANYPGKSLYEPGILRTLFLDFSSAGWEKELEDFHGTDVDVPCTLTVDGKAYQNVGVHFRGMSSYMMVRNGQKRSLNLSLDHADSNQRLDGYKTLNLLNSHEDPSFLSTVLYSELARSVIPAPKASMVKVVINGESWGIYTNVQQFDKVFLKENYKTTSGTRWKVRGNPGASGGLEFQGDDPQPYKARFEIKSGDKPEAWKALVNLCKVLNTTPPDKLEQALKPILDIDSVLWFLAMDIALINNDGYWIRSSDYTLFLDDKGIFHLVPHDMNEAFRPMMGPPGMGGFGMPRPGDIIPPFIADILELSPDQKTKLDSMQKEVDRKLDALFTEAQRNQWRQLRQRGGPPGPGGPGGPPGGGPGAQPVLGGFRLPMGPMGGGGGINVDPLMGLDDPRKPLRSKLLTVPALRQRYLQHVATIAREWLDWKNLGPRVARWRDLVAREIEADTRKLSTSEEFMRLTSEQPAPEGRDMPLKVFAEKRRAFLLNHPEVKKPSS